MDFYRSIIAAYRGAYSRAQVEAAFRLATLYRNTEEAMVGMVVANYVEDRDPATSVLVMNALRRRIARRLEDHAAQYRDIIGRGAKEAAEAMVERDRLLLGKYDRDALREASVLQSFHRATNDAMEEAAKTEYRDGRSLNWRMKHLRALHLIRMNEALSPAAALASVSQQVALVKSAFGHDAKGGLFTRAEILQQTTLNEARRFAVRQIATNTSAGVIHPFAKAIAWRLGPTHRAPDLCDLYASHDAEGWGPGLYHPLRMPPSHPRCSCGWNLIPSAHASLDAVEVEPRPELIPLGLLESEAARGNPIAAAFLKSRKAAA